MDFIFSQAFWPGQGLSGSGPRLPIGALWRFFQKRDLGPNLRPWRPRTRHLDRYAARATSVIIARWGTPLHRWNRAEPAHRTRTTVFESAAFEKHFFQTPPMDSIFSQAPWPGQGLSESGLRLPIGALWRFFRKRDLRPNLRPWRPRTRHLDRHAAGATPVIITRCGTPAHRWNRADAAHRTRTTVFGPGHFLPESIFRPTSPIRPRKNKFYYRSLRLNIPYNFSPRGKGSVRKSTFRFP